MSFYLLKNSSTSHFKIHPKTILKPFRNVSNSVELMSVNHNKLRNRIARQHLYQFSTTNVEFVSRALPFGRSS